MLKAAGGFAGNLEGTVLGEKGTKEAGVSVQNIRYTMSQVIQRVNKPTLVIATIKPLAGQHLW